MREQSWDAVWAEASFSLVPLGAREHHEVRLTLWQGGWSFVRLCLSVIGLRQGDSHW